jgi:hypothetical protein
MFLNKNIQKDFFNIIKDSRNLNSKNKKDLRFCFWVDREDKVYFYSNQESLDSDWGMLMSLGLAINSGQIQEVTHLLRSASDMGFAMECINRTAYNQKRNQKLVADLVSGMVNSSGGMEEFVEVLLKDHRTLQQSFVRNVIMPYLSRMAESRSFDARNQASVEFAKAVKPIIEQTYCPLI